MNTSTRLAVAAHIVSVLASKRGRFVKSSDIAGSVNTNPSFVRRILCSLTQAGIVEAEKGRAGGSRLVRCPDELTLWDLARALGEKRLLSVHKNPVNPRCPISRGMKQALAEAFAGVEEAAQEQMKRVKVGDLLPG